MNLVERGRAGDYFIPNSSTSLTLHSINNTEVIVMTVLNMFKASNTMKCLPLHIFFV